MEKGQTYELLVFWNQKRALDKKNGKYLLYNCVNVGCVHTQRMHRTTLCYLQHFVNYGRVFFFQELNR